MAYLSMCVNELNEYKEATFYMTYHQDGGPKEVIGICPVDEKGNMLRNTYDFLETKLFYSHFKSLHYSASLKIRYKKERTDFVGKLLGNFVKAEYREDYLSFLISDYRMVDYQELSHRVLMPLFKLELMSKEMCSSVLGGFYSILRYTFDTINTFYKNKDLVNYELALEKAELLIKEIYDFSFSLIKNENEAINLVKGAELQKLENTYSMCISSYIEDLKSIDTDGTFLRGCRYIG